LFLYVEWTLGVHREESARHLVTDFDGSGEFLYATNFYNNEFAGRVVSIGSSQNISSYTTSRSEFIGRHRGISNPRHFDPTSASALSTLLNPGRVSPPLSGRTGAGFDTCAVIQIDLILAAHEQRGVMFYLNESVSLVEARKNAECHRSIARRAKALSEVQKFWNDALTAIEVRTPDRSFDILMNGWLLYQTISCRLFSRSAFYQSGGAIGFRDQLQDSLALLYTRPEFPRAQILLHAARQFVEGDAQHWWHPPTGRGVRDRISDDYLWLPYLVTRYLQRTADWSILDEVVPYLEAPLLEPGQMESYTTPHISGRTGTLYEHCVLALDRSLVVGQHDLPLIGSGDWNDGMNEVGSEGRGESVWLAWFLSSTLRDFADICEHLADSAHQKLYQEHSQKLVTAIETHGWDGEWYRRAYFDDGTPLGSASNDECRIDSISQSWSVIAGGGDPNRSARAMNAAVEQLVCPQERLIRLLTPPFDKGSTQPGYIKGYVPGTRENGGQYTHAAAWLILAVAKQGKGDEAMQLFSMVNPINHTRDPNGVETYKGEPYVLAGDVYSVAPHTGRVGWSWYTGSSSWIYQVGLEHLLGLKVFPTYFTLDPVVPTTWKEFSLKFRNQGVLYDITVQNPEGAERGVVRTMVAGVLREDHRIRFAEHSAGASKVITVSITLGSRTAGA
jgi:cyclic beta-1,2-glucan synthetase